MSLPQLTHLRIGSPQVLGALRLVPVCRDEAPGDLRMRKRDYEPVPAIVALEKAYYVSYIPHGLVVSHTKDGTEAIFGTSLGKEKGRRGRCVNLLHRMVKQEEDGRFRFLPLHLAMEGFLALHFNGPDIAWSEYSREAVRYGLSPRVETSVAGRWIQGLEDALRVFEIHPTQVGVMVFVAETLASVFVVSHPADYRLLHRSLIEDFFGELIYEHALLYPQMPRTDASIDAERVASLADLRGEVERVRRDWADYTHLLAQGFFGREVRTETVRTLSPFRLERFLPEFDPNEECHIGERIVREDGTLEYMKTFRLSAAQVRRAYLLEQLARAGWHLDTAAEHLRCTREALIQRLENAGFGYLLKPHVRLCR